MLSIKKIMAGVLVGAMALSFTACSGAKTKTESEASAISKPLTSASPKATATPKASAKPKATATPKATQKPTQAPQATATPAPTQAPQATATPAPTEAPSQTTASGFSEQDARNLLATPCWVLEGFDDESYNVDYDMSVVYKGVWDSWDEVGSDAPSYLVSEDEVTDDTPTNDGVYYHVTSVDSDDEARSNLLGYMSSDVVNQLYGTPLYDFGNTTYILRDRGYAPINRDFNNATISDLTDTSFTATMDCYEFSADNYAGTCTINMSKDGDSWYIVGYSQNF